MVLGDPLVLDPVCLGVVVDGAGGEDETVELGLLLAEREGREETHLPEGGLSALDGLEREERGRRGTDDIGGASLCEGTDEGGLCVEHGGWWSCGEGDDDVYMDRILDLIFNGPLTASPAYWIQFSSPTLLRTHQVFLTFHASYDNVHAIFKILYFNPDHRFHGPPLDHELPHRIRDSQSFPQASSNSLPIPQSAEYPPRFLRDEDPSISWNDQLAAKYYANLYREFALCDLKHYKSGNVGSIHNNNTLSL